MTEILLARADEALAGNAASGAAPSRAETALCIAGHGTPKNENSRKAIEHQAELLRARNIYAEVHAVFMEEEPRVSDCYRLTRWPDIVVVPFFISDGLHTFEDIPVMLGESAKVVRERMRRGEPAWINPTERHGKRLWYARSVGTEPHLAEVILQRVREAAGC
jgi:sirohydrochlorin cobaltochelatase